MIAASEAIKRLKEGNQRFLSGVRSIDTIVKQIQRADFVECLPKSYSIRDWEIYL